MEKLLCIFSAFYHILPPSQLNMDFLAKIPILVLIEMYRDPADFGDRAHPHIRTKQPYPEVTILCILSFCR